MLDSELKKLKTKFKDSEDKNLIKAWEQGLAECELMKDLSEHAGMREYLEDKKVRIANIENELKIQEVIDEAGILTRKTLQIELTILKEFLAYFTDWETKLKTIEGQIKENL